MVVHAGRHERAIPLGGILAVAFCAMTLTPGTRSLTTGGTTAVSIRDKAKKKAA